MKNKLYKLAIVDFIENKQNIYIRVEWSENKMRISTTAILVPMERI
jgi:hypothetical protein